MKKLPTRSVYSAANQPKEETIDAMKTIDSLLSDKMKISTGQWAISIVKSKGKEHAFLILEGRVQEKFVILRTDLFMNKDSQKTLLGIDITQGNIIDKMFEFSASSKGQAFVRLKEITLANAQEIVHDCEFQGFTISTDQAEKLLKRFCAEGFKEYNYHMGGDNSSFSASDSRSTRTSCVAWCEMILREELAIDIGNTWHLIKIPGSRVALAKKFAAHQANELSKETHDTQFGM